MQLQDLFITPFYLALFYVLAYAVRPKVTNIYTKKYFIPALTLKFFGAIALGLIYQFYYRGGDTFNYYYHSNIVHEAFNDSFTTGLKLLTANENTPEISRYTIRMFWFGANGGNNTEFFVVRIATFFGLFCFNCYSVIALLFALLSFTGVWAMYTVFVRLYPAAYKQLAIASFFLPSVFFWGSGLMKDSLCLGALGWVFYGFYYGLILKRNILRAILLGGLGAYLLIMIKVYILMSFLAPASLWVFNENSQRINNALLRSLLKPFFILIGLLVGYFGSVNLTKGDERFDVEKIGERSRITQQALYSRTKDKGSAYNIGKLDGSLGSIINVAPQAIFVTLYRPFIWEARNPIMLLSALESLWFTWFTASILLKAGLARSLRLISARPILPFCLIFTLIFAVGVGVNSGNFGTLVRYKIPLMPFYLSALYILYAEATRKIQPAHTLNTVVA